MAAPRRGRDRSLPDRAQRRRCRARRRQREADENAAEGRAARHERERLHRRLPSVETGAVTTARDNPYATSRSSPACHDTISPEPNAMRAVVLALTLLTVPCSAQDVGVPPADPWFSTFSIIAFDPATNELGVGVQSRAFAAGAAVPFAKPGVGAVATQASANRQYGPKAI